MCNELEDELFSQQSRLRNQNPTLFVRKRLTGARDAPFVRHPFYTPDSPPPRTNRLTAQAGHISRLLAGPSWLAAAAQATGAQGGAE